MWVAAALCACGRDDVLFMGYRTRSEIMGGKPGARQEDSEYREGENTGTPDTVLFACGVEWPEDYDWRRDSCAGAVRGKLVLFRKGRTEREGQGFYRVLEVPAGPGLVASPQTDMHHLVGGHLYSEKTEAGKTSLSLDGKSLFSFPGRYMLAGLLPGEGQELRTLWQDRSGAGLRLMAGSRVLFEKGDAIPLWSMSGPGNARCGALHEDGGRCCFGFFTRTGGEEAVYLCVDGEATQVATDGSLSKVLDLRMSGGELWLLGITGNELVVKKGGEPILVDADAWWWSEAYLLDYGGKPGVCLKGTYDDALPGLYLWAQGAWLELLYPDPAGMLVQDKTDIAVFGYYRGGDVDAGKNAQGNFLPASSYFLRYPSGTCLCGREFALALTDLQTGENYVWTRNEPLPVPLRGCLTGVEYVVVNKE